MYENEVHGLRVNNGILQYYNGSSWVDVGDMQVLIDHISENADVDNVHGLRSASVALGENSNAPSNFSVAVGYNASATSGSGVALGRNAITGSSLALGNGAEAETIFSAAIGRGSVAENAYTGFLGVGGTGNTGLNKWIVPGNFTVNGTKNFEIPHPHPNKKDTHRIRHAAVESPTAGDTLYRYEVEATEDGEKVEMQLPDYFQYLNKDVDVYVNGHKHFGNAFGEVEGDALKITCEKVGLYKVLVIGTRNDDHQSVQDWSIKAVEREVGESWTGETYAFSQDEIIEITEIEEVS